MPRRRTTRISCGSRPRWASRRNGARNRTGMIRSLEIIVLSATVATMIIAVAADNPPR